VGLNNPSSNQGAPGVEVTPGPRWLTIRSDNNDKFAQPDGVWIGSKGTPTHVTFAGPELRGATNVVLPGIDHRETSYGAPAFAATYRFITGQDPVTTGFGRPADVRIPVSLAGKVSGQGLANDPATGSYFNNLPLAGATVEVYATSATTGERQGAALLRLTTGADGLWGPLNVAGNTALEFVVAAPGYATVHTYRAAFARPSRLVYLRAEKLPAAVATDAPGTAQITFTRPRGYFGVPRDTVALDGANPAPGIPAGVAGVSTSRIKVVAPTPRAVVAQFNQQQLVGRTWPLADGHVVVLELHD
jgi:triacylglycerol lipase